jgi:hypothetical protein
MAFPTVVGTAQWDSAGASVTTNRAQIPAGVVAGDLILVLYARDSQAGAGTGTNGFTRVNASNAAAIAAAWDACWYYRIADGSESGTMDFATLTGDRCGSQTYLLRGWGDLPVEGVWSSSSSSVSPNPPSLTTGFGAVDTLWIEATGIDAQGRTLTASTSYANVLNGPATGVGGLSYSTARRTTTAASEDPAAVTWSGAAALSSAMVLGIRGPVEKTADDAGAGADTKGGTAPAATYSVADAGTGTEASQVGQSKVASDAGTGADAVVTLAIALARSDTAVGTEGLGARTFAVADAGVGTETAEVEILAVGVETRPMPQSLEAVLRSHHTPVARLLFMGSDLETILHAVEAAPGGDNQWLLSGNVSMERARNIHRQASVSLVNQTGQYSPVDAASLVWPNRLVRIERGARIVGVAQYSALITGVIDDWTVDGESGEVKFSVWSRLHLADQQFSIPTTYPTGLPVAVAIRAIAELGGLGTTDALYDLHDGGLTLPEPRVYDMDDNILASMIRLAFDNGLDLYDDGAGVLVMHPFVDPSTTMTDAWHFRTGADATMTAIERRGRAGILYNRAVVVSIGGDRYPIRAEARVLNPVDPLYNPVDGTGPVGDRPRPIYTTSDATGQQAANDLATRLLIEGALYEESIAAAAVPIPILGDRDVVRFTAAGTDDRYLLDSIDIPIGPGTMRMTTRRVRSLIADPGASGSGGGTASPA